MADATGIVLIKQFTYRDDPTEEWSNKYWLTGAPPGDTATWKALVDLLISHEKTCYSPTNKVVMAYAYDSDDPNAQTVWSYDYLGAGQSVAGTLNGIAGDTPYAGDQAGIAWWKTSRKNSRGKWIYLRKYFHGGLVNGADRDKPSTSTTDAYQAFATLLVSAQLDNRVIRSQKQVESIQTWGHDPWVTTRSLKRRGKRP